MRDEVWAGRSPDGAVIPGKRGWSQDSGLSCNPIKEKMSLALEVRVEIGVLVTCITRVTRNLRPMLKVECKS